MPTPCAGGFPRLSQAWAKLSALGTAAATVKSHSARGSCTPVAEALSVLPPGLGLELLAEGSFGWQERKGHQNQGEESAWAHLHGGSVGVGPAWAVLEQPPRHS